MPKDLKPTQERWRIREEIGIRSTRSRVSSDGDGWHQRRWDKREGQPKSITPGQRSSPLSRSFLGNYCRGGGTLNGREEEEEEEEDGRWFERHYYIAAVSGVGIIHHGSRGH